MSDVGPSAYPAPLAQPVNTIFVVFGLAFSDAIIMAAAYVVSWTQSRLVGDLAGRVWQIADAVFCIGILYLALASGGYRRAMLNNPFSQISRILVNATVLSGLEWIGLRALNFSDFYDWPMNGPLNAVSIGVLLMCLLRLLTNRLLDFGARRGAFIRNVAIVGADVQGIRLITALKQRKEPWTRIVGIFDDRKKRLTGAVDGHKIDGTVEDLIALSRDVSIDDILVALPWGAEHRLLAIVEQLKVIPANVHLAPDIIGHHFLDKGYTRVDGVPVFNVFGKPISDWGALFKRAEDLVLGSLILLMVTPIMLACAVAIRIDSPGPIFFRQRRFGYNNKLIDVFKFRSMYHHMRDETASRLVTQGDPRITPVGRFLRRTSLDELPQLLNVIFGDMSLVGPRPHAVQAKAGGKLYQEVVAEYAVRHRVKPGITGWAQVMGWRGETDTEQKIVNRVACDLYYMENWSLFLDIEILFRTLFVVTGKSVY